MLSFKSLACMATLLSTTLGQSVAIYNMSPEDLCYVVNIVSGTFPTTTTCSSTQGNGDLINGPGVTVKAGQSLTVNTSPNFNAAFTPIVRNGWPGVRNEINFKSQETWYDIDYEMGMSDGTLGPASHQPQLNGLPSLAGEQDCLAKAAAAWPTAINKAALLANSTYLAQAADGTLTHVYNEKESPDEVKGFFQYAADFNGYVFSYSNTFSWSVGTMDMEIISY